MTSARTILWAAAYGTVACAFTASNHHPASSSSSALHQELPFFANPAFTAAASSTSTSTGSTSSTNQSAPSQATITLRLPLGTLFDGRDYIFVTESNVRGYEWTEKETDILLDDLMDAALGTLGGQEGSTNSNDDNSGKKNQPPPSQITDYELSQIVLVPTADWDSTLLGLGSRYDVYDGQQRLVTLNLLLASLRDSFQVESSSNNININNNEGGGSSSVTKRAVALKATASEISGMLMPKKVRKVDVMRITLRKRDNKLLEQILMDRTDVDGDSDVLFDDEQDDAHGNDGAAVASKVLQQPTHTWSKLTTKQQSELLAPLSNANARILHNFIHLSKRLSLLSTRERLRLLDYVVERVYLLVCIPETSRIARNIVMSQGRKGMDNEPVDDFKGLVCFRYTLDEDDMYETFDQWDELAAEPSAAITSTSTDGSSSDTSRPMAVGREIISSACLLRASASLRTKIRSRGGDEVYEWERWLRQELWLQNQLLQQTLDDAASSSQQPWQGKDFFAQKIQPAAIALYKFRTRQWDEFLFMSKDVNKKLTKKKRSELIARLDFLRDVIMGVTSAKEAEIVVLDVLIRAEEEAMNGGGASLARYLDEFLPLVESWTLWMALTRPSPMQRHARVFALLDAMDDIDSVGADISADEDEMKNLKASMDEYEFGASAGGKRLAAAILKRMSTHLMLEEKKGIPDNDDVTVDFILPPKFAKSSEWEKQWPDEEQRGEWMNRIGNLALVTSRPRSRSRAKKGSDTSWEQKCINLKKEPWLLTRQLIELDGWDAAAVQDQQKDILSLMDLVWSFGEDGLGK